MTNVSTPLDVSTSDAAMGNLLITDANVLIRPAIRGQYPPSVRHDSAHAYRVLNVGNDMGQYTWHIVTDKQPEAADQMLDRVFYAYVDMACLERWCDARVVYQAGDHTVFVREYGFEDGQYTMGIVVHCGVTDPEALVAKLMEEMDSEELKEFDQPLVVVRPDNSPAGYHADLFHKEWPEDEQDDVYTGSSEEDDGYGNYDDPDEEPLAGDTDDGLHYVPEPSPLTTQHYHALRERGYF